MPTTRTSRTSAGPDVETADFVTDPVPNLAAAERELAAAESAQLPGSPAVTITDAAPLVLAPPETARDLALRMLQTPPPIAEMPQVIAPAAQNVTLTGQVGDWSDGDPDFALYVARTSPYRRQFPNPEWEKGAPAEIPRNIVRQARRGDVLQLPVDDRTTRDLTQGYLTPYTG